MPSTLSASTPVRLVLLAIAFAGSGAVANGLDDPWYGDPAKEGRPPLTSRMPRETLVIVSDDAQPVARRRLEKEEFYEISAQEAATYGSAAFGEANRGRRFFVVRALYEADNGVFSVRHNGADVEVNNASLSAGGDLRRVAALVALDFVPRRVYSNSSGAR